MQPDFIHLRVHTEYSLVDGLVRIKPLIKRVAELGMPAVGVTDQSNLFALVKFYRSAIAEGIKPIAGADVLIYNEADPTQPFGMTLLVQNATGYRTLTQLISRAYQEGQHQGVPMLLEQWLTVDHEGLIALSGARQGEAGRAILAGNLTEARSVLKKWGGIFRDRFYIELQRTEKPGEEVYIARAADLATALDLPVVATNDVRFIRREEFDAHEARVCIHQGRVLDDARRPREYTDAQYLRSTEEMLRLFSDIPEALQNSVEIAKRCNLELTLGQNFLPSFPLPEGVSLDDYFVDMSRKGLEQRLTERPPAAKGSAEQARRIYEERLDMEMGVIRHMGFPGYFMIVADFIQWAKTNGIPVGPGRGSGAGSLVAYALRITDLDPIEFDLLFERFLNPERVSMPDFDVDFCMERRDRVIEYVAQRYGRDRVSQIITYGSMAAKAVVRDVGRVLGHSYGFVDKLAKLIPFEIGMTLTKALAESEELRTLYEKEDEVRGLIDLAKALEGVARNAGKHAGGVVIAPRALTDFTPLYCEQGGGNLVTQFDKDDVEAVGLVKFDFLGLRTLTIIDWALQTINGRRRDEGLQPVDIDRIPRDDPATYVLLKSAATTAVFQLESRGMKELIRKLQPDNFEDIIALVALFRPGPLDSGMVDDYINVKHGRAKAEYAHPSLEPILRPTNGVILYQEQVMQIARDMAGYTLGGADLLRRAMGKKKPEEMAKQRAIFTEGAVGNGVEESVATYVFDLMEKFAGYGFNKSHSAAYAWVAYQTAWLKAHFPAEFMAAVLSADMDNTDKVVVLIEECRNMHLEILPPDINVSDFRFTVRDDGKIVYGLGAIKGVGQNAIEEVLGVRKQGGVFSGLYDLCKRVDLRKVNRRVMEALIKAGALDGLGYHRAATLSELPVALKVAEQHGELRQTGQNDLFGLFPADEEGDGLEVYSTAAEPWAEDERLSAEKSTLGLWLTGHPIDQYEAELAKITSGRIGALLESMERSHGRTGGACVAGLVVDLRTRQSKLGKRMGFATLDDRTGRMEMAVYSDTFEQYQDLLSKDSLLVAEGALGMDDFSGALRLTAEKMYSIEQARALYARCLEIRWTEDGEAFAGGSAKKVVAGLSKILQPFQGGRCPVTVSYRSKKARSMIQFGDAWRVNPTDELLVRLERYLGRDGYHIDYAGRGDHNGSNRD